MPALSKFGLAQWTSMWPVDMNPPFVPSSHGLSDKGSVADVALMDRLVALFSTNFFLVSLEGMAVPEVALAVGADETFDLSVLHLVVTVESPLVGTGLAAGIALMCLRVIEMHLGHVGAEGASAVEFQVAHVAGELDTFVHTPNMVLQARLVGKDLVTFITLKGMRIGMSSKVEVTSGFDKCHETSRIFPRTMQTFASAKSFGVIS